MLISIDHGNSAVKATNFIFTSELSEHSVRPPRAVEVIEYNGSYWVLSGQRISYMRNKTGDERYFVLTLFSIAKELDNVGSLTSEVEVDLAAGLSPEHFSDDVCNTIQVDLSSNPAIFIGGGAILFKELIESFPLVVKSKFIIKQRANAIKYLQIRKYSSFPYLQMC